MRDRERERERERGREICILIYFILLDDVVIYTVLFSFYLIDESSYHD